MAQTINTVLELSNKLTANLDESEKDSLNLFDRVKYVLESNTISDRMKKTCTIDSVDETGIEIGFVTKEGKKGYYIIQYNEEQFTYEKLFYNIKKRSGVVFEIHSAANVKAKDLMNVCQVESRREALLEMVHKYWGKHTLLSIVNNEKEEATQSYVDGTYTKSVLDVIDEIASYNIAGSWHVPDDGSAELYPFRDSLSKGIILKSDEKRLDRYENAIRVYLTESYSDITDVHYDRKYKNDSIQYTLFIEKMINGERKTISIDNESNGTKHVVDLLGNFLYALSGGTVVYDEIEIGIHDLLLSSIIKALSEELSGQLIMTTHNTQLIEDTSPKNCYVIRIGYGGVKQVNCFTDFGRIQPHNNVKKMYLSGLFGGIPETSLDFSEIVDFLKEDGRDE